MVMQQLLHFSTEWKSDYTTKRYIKPEKEIYELFWCWRQNIPALGSIPYLLMPWVLIQYKDGILPV